MNNPMAWLADRIADVVVEEGARVRAALEAGTTKTVNGLRVTGARPQQVRPNAVNGGTGRLVGWSLRETTGSAPALVTVYAARDAGDPGAVVAVIPLAAGAGGTHLPAPPGVSFGDGLYVAVAGAVDGALYFDAVR